MPMPKAITERPDRLSGKSGPDHASDLRAMVREIVQDELRKEGQKLAEYSRDLESR